MGKERGKWQWLPWDVGWGTGLYSRSAPSCRMAERLCRRLEQGSATGEGAVVWKGWAQRYRSKVFRRSMEPGSPAMNISSEEYRGRSTSWHGGKSAGCHAHLYPHPLSPHPAPAKAWCPLSGCPAAAHRINEHAGGGILPIGGTAQLQADGVGDAPLQADGLGQHHVPGYR